MDRDSEMLIRKDQAAPKRDPIVVSIAVASCVLSAVCVIMIACIIPTLNNIKDKQSDMSYSLSSSAVTKWSAAYETPRYYQEDRGTCWDFATIGLLEQSYREQGVKNGYLDDDEYLQLSEQAYGIQVIQQCQIHPEVCDVPGDYALENSTEGGEIGWIYSLTALYDKVLPVKVCPYTDQADEAGYQHAVFLTFLKTSCPGMDEALKDNPLLFDIKSMELAYSATDTRTLLLKHRKPLGWSSLMHVVTFYLPCTDEYWSEQAACNETNRVACPTDRWYNSDYCVELEGAMYNMDGEFYAHGTMELEGGHAMNAVGFNDGFTTQAGYKGGFIIRNSWHDQIYGSDPSGRGARGSHSISYWMQEISLWDEAAICPNPLNPENWLSCVQQSVGPTGRRATRSTVSTTPLKSGPLGATELFDISETCLDDTFMSHLLNVSLQPLEFYCVDEDFCATSANYRYFLASIARDVQGDMLSVSMLRYNTLTGDQFMITTPMNNPSAIVYIFQPLQYQQDYLANDPDLCGYYFWPYDMLDQQVGLYRNFYAHYLEIEWDEQSYLANKDDYPSLNYTLIKLSSGTQGTADFPTTNPHDKVRY